MFLTFGKGDERVAIDDKHIQALAIHQDEETKEFGVYAFMKQHGIFRIKRCETADEAADFIDDVTKDINAGRVQDIVEEKIDDIIRQWAENDERPARDEND